MNMTQPSKTLYFNTLHYVDVIVYIVQLKIVPVCLKPAAQVILSIRMLKKLQDRESSCLKPRLASKGSDTTHIAFLSVISQRLISFAGMPNSDMVAYR